MANATLGHSAPLEHPLSNNVSDPTCGTESPPWILLGKPAGVRNGTEA
jgi:hypothetical protein